jgi:hypothetical protein
VIVSTTGTPHAQTAAVRQQRPWRQRRGALVLQGAAACLRAPWPVISVVHGLCQPPQQALLATLLGSFDVG